jgi:sugar/nucleoside kinase (ribokinase family)
VKKSDVLVAGELNVDLIMSGLDQFPVLEKEIMAKEMLLTLGSSSAIFASNLSVIGSNVAFAGMIGKDSFGELVLASLQMKKVSCDFILQSAKNKTGCTVAIILGNDRAMLTHAGAMEEFSEQEITDAMLSSAKHLHVSSVFLQPKLKEGLPSLFLRAKKSGLTTSLDPQWDPEEKWDLPLRDLLPNVDVFLPNAGELSGFTNTTDLQTGIEQLRSFANIVVAKDSTNGAWCSTKEKVIFQPAFLNANQVDAIGAGDSFDAGFIHQFISGKNLKECLRFAALMGAVNTTAAGGTGAFDSIDSIKEKAMKFFGEKF